MSGSESGSFQTLFTTFPDTSRDINQQIFQEEAWV